jgi:hypothetical protein
VAATVTALAAGSADTANGTSYSGTAGTPSAGDLLIAFVNASGTVAAGTMTGVWTWKKLTSATKASVDTLYIFYAEATAATSTTPVFDCTGDGATGACISVMRLTGLDGQAQPYIRQIATATASTANPSVTFGAAVLTGNLVIGACSNSTNSAVQFTAPASWTELHEVAHASPTQALETCYRLSGETGTTITWTNANTTAWVAYALELYIAGTGPEMVDDGGRYTGFFGLQGGIG